MVSMRMRVIILPNLGISVVTIVWKRGIVRHVRVQALGTDDSVQLARFRTRHHCSSKTVTTSGLEGSILSTWLKTRQSRHRLTEAPRKTGQHWPLHVREGEYTSFE
jgi:hypothetical protein